MLGCAGVDALALSQIPIMEEIGLPLVAATTMAGYFGNVGTNTVDPELELQEPELEPELQESELEAEPALEEPELESPSGPMAEFDEAAVLAWVAGVPGLTVAQRAGALERVAEEEYDGEELAAVKPKRLLKLLKGSEAEGAVPRLLAARDAQLEAEEEAAAAAAVAASPAEHAEAELAERPSCPICMEPYSATGGVVPRMLVTCGHAFCEACMARMLRCVGTNRASRASACAHHCARLVGRPLPANGAGKRLECPTCRKECVVKGGRVTELPLVYGMQGP